MMIARGLQSAIRPCPMMGNGGGMMGNGGAGMGMIEPAWAPAWARHGMMEEPISPAARPGGCR